MPDRDALRVRVDAPVFVWATDPPGPPAPARLADVSVTGARLAGWSAPVGTRCRVAWDPRDGGPLLVLAAEVRRAAPDEAGVAWVGLPIAVENRLGHFVRRRERRPDL